MSIIIEYMDKLYPEKLRNIKRPPTRLYVEGNIEILNEIGISVVGSRTNTKYGEKMCKKFVEELVEYNINIISGLAIGIDCIAHKTCLKNGGKTIAVLPSGLKSIYPAKHKELANTIINNGGIIISEYDDNVKADSKKFLERNRIVAGLGIGTLVIEGGHRSGTSVTARYTIEENKPVFCIPSSLENKKGKATNELIKKGAELVTNVKDIIDFHSELNFQKRKMQKRDIFLDIPNELRDIFRVINNIPLDANEIANRTGKGIDEINYKITMLQIENKIIELPGQRYIRKEED